MQRKLIPGPCASLAANDENGNESNNCFDPFVCERHAFSRSRPRTALCERDGDILSM